MNKNIKIGDRVSAEWASPDIGHTLPEIKKIKGVFKDVVDGFAIVSSNTDGREYFVVPSSLRKLVKKKKPEIFTTSKGFVFTKTSLGWIDQTSGLEWMNEFKAGLNHYDSEKWAAGQKMRLPTREEFIEAEKHGIRELPGMLWRGYWFWTSTQGSGNDGRYAYEFFGSNGDVGYSGYRDYSNSYVAARAVRKV